MNTLLLEYLSTLLEAAPRKREFKAVSVGDDGTERVVAFASKEKADAAVVAGTHRPYFPDTDAKLEKEPSKQPDEKITPPETVGAPTRDVKPLAPNRPSPSLTTALNTEELTKIEAEFVDDDGPESDEMRDDYQVTTYAMTDLPKEYSDEVYYSPKNGGRGRSTKVRKTPYFFDKKIRTSLKSRGFPEKYIKFLERCINTKIAGSKPPVTELIDVGGAGQIASQFGEVVSMAMMAIPRDDRAKFATVMQEQIKESMQELGDVIAGSKADYTKQGKSTGNSWVDAAVTHAEAFDAAMDEKYGVGNWQFEGAAWDIRDDVEALGLPYENKGFSTDVVLRVRTPDGPRSQRVSLKKDENIMFFNGSIGEINNFVLNYTDERSRKRIRMLEQLIVSAGAGNKNLEQRKVAIESIKKLTNNPSATAAISQARKETERLRSEVLKAAPADVQQLVRDINEFSSTQLTANVKMAKNIHTRTQNASAGRVKAAIEAEFSGKAAGDQPYAALAWKITKQCSTQSNMANCIKDKLQAAGESVATDRVAKICVFAARVAQRLGDKKATAELNAVYSIGRRVGTRLMEAIPEHPELMGGVMQKLATAFPLKVCMAGTELMLIDGIKITQQTLQTVFGTDDYASLERGLDILRLPNGESILVYKIDGEERTVSIGYVQGRQKGLGYQGSVGFEIKCSDEFALACAEANANNGDESSSNTSAVSRISGRIAKRDKKGKISGS